jgi:hypothetical protein
MTMKTHLRLSVVVLALAGVVVSAQPKKAPKAPCPAHRVSDGDRCRVEGQSCSWRCGQEGSRSRSCDCARADGGTALTWQCGDGPVCSL